MARTRSSIRRPKIACTPPSPSWPSPWPTSPSNMTRSVAFQAAMPPFLGACFGGAGLSLPIRAKLGLFLAPIFQGFLCAFLCVLSGNPSELGRLSGGRKSPAHRQVHHGPHHGRSRHRIRSEEHTSELQSLRHLVCRLLLEKK